jgi:hypothetical protein
VQRHAGAAQQLAAAGQLEHVVGVAAVGGAATQRDEASVAQLAEVVRDQALPPPGQLAQLAHAPIAARQLAQQPPPQRVAREPQEARRRAVAMSRRGYHPGDNTSIQFDPSGASALTSLDGMVDPNSKVDVFTPPRRC